MSSYVERRRALINRLLGEIHAEEKRITNSNYAKFEEEVRNLIDCVGKGFTGGDYYAPRRYYSEIPGVKNIRFNDHVSGHDTAVIDVKVTSSEGYLLPKKILGYDVVFTQSSNYEECLNY